jgi:hypothetical protein
MLKMPKMPKMQNIPNLFLLISRDDQLAYFILLTPLMDARVTLRSTHSFEEGSFTKDVFSPSHYNIVVFWVYSKLLLLHDFEFCQTHSFQIVVTIYPFSLFFYKMLWGGKKEESSK